LAREKLEWHRREKLTADGEFSHTELDANRRAEGVEVKRGWHVMWGKFKGMHLSAVPDVGWLFWHSKLTKNEAYRQAIQREIQRRRH
jgi:hypothetical protein